MEQVRAMIGIVLVTHGRLAAEFRAALEHVAGPQKQIESIAIGPDDDSEQRRQDIVSAITRTSAETLGLKPGDQVRAIIKSTEVMIDKS